MLHLLFVLTFMRKKEDKKEKQKKSGQRVYEKKSKK